MTRYPEPEQRPEGGVKHDDGKERHDLLPVDALEEISAILAHGARQYGERNWEKGIAFSRLYRALLRHIWAWWRRKGNDKDTGRSHLAHAACCVLFLLVYELRHMDTFDDRCQDQGGSNVS